MDSIYQSRILITGRQLTPGRISQNPLLSDENTDRLIPELTFKLPLDNVYMHGFRFSNINSRQPTNAGTPRSDNTARLPVAYRIEGLISRNTWNKTKLGPLLLDFTDIFNNKNYLTEAFSSLRSAAFNPYIYKVNAGFAVFESMAIENMDVTQSIDSVNCLKLVLTMAEAIKSPSDFSQPEDNINKPPLNRGRQSG